MDNKTIQREIPVELSEKDFRKIGYYLVDKIAELIGNIGKNPITRAEEEKVIQALLESDKPLPEEGVDPFRLTEQASDMIIKHSLYNGHPRFWGYITSSPAPLGILGDFLSSAINSNVGAWALSPMASEIEAQTVRWIGSLIRYPSKGGLIVSGGNVANYIGFIAAIRAKAGLDIRTEGISTIDKKLTLYCSDETHTWIHKAADLFGLGTDNIRWIRTDGDRKLDIGDLIKTINKDIDNGHFPFLVVGTAGSVSTGVVDPLDAISRVCKDYNLWFHIDGAYGGFAAALPELKSEFQGLDMADSIAVDPHKWLYAPLEAGCTLVKDPTYLTDAFSYHPPYYNFEKSAINYVDYGIQNSRGFKALKVWLILQQMGRNGYQQLIREDILLAKYAHDLIAETNCLEAFTNNLSITTFRYVPVDLAETRDKPKIREYLNDLNKKILEKIEKSGKFYTSNAVIDEIFLLRMCIVNFRTKSNDIQDFVSYLVEIGKHTDTALRT